MRRGQGQEARKTSFNEGEKHRMRLILAAVAGVLLAAQVFAQEAAAVKGHIESCSG